jgi:hypothetical protein
LAAQIVVFIDSNITVTWNFSTPFPLLACLLACLLIYLFIYLFIFWFFEAGFLCEALAVLELTLKTRLASNSEIPLPLPPKCWD